MMELLVTIAILSLLMAGLSQLVVTNSQNASATGALARIADTGRTAIQLLAADTRRAGYLGGNIDLLNAADMISGTAGLAATLEPGCVAATTDWARRLDQPLFGLNDTNAGYACIADDEYTRGDVLTLRYAATPPLPEDTNYEDEDLPDGPYLRATLTEGRLFFRSNANDAENNIDDPSVRDHNLVAHTYFVGPTGRTCQGAAIPALFRKAIDDNGLPVSQELLAGVENLQLRYLVDNRYYDAGEGPLAGPGRWPLVDAVEISVLVRAECPEAGFDINRTFELGDVSYNPAEKDFRRQVFTTTTQLRN
jgi:type II secretory pathway pseudopilin PulG